MLELNWKGRKYFCAGELVEVATSLDALTAVWYFAGKIWILNQIQFNKWKSYQIFHLKTQQGWPSAVLRLQSTLSSGIWEVIHFSYLKHKHRDCTLKMFRTEAASNPAFWTLTSASTAIWGGGISTEYILYFQAIQASTCDTSFCRLIKYSI